MFIFSMFIVLFWWYGGVILVMKVEEVVGLNLVEKL